ncbi:hypothetical protein ABI59_14270 [Acidobacteria bacterium Mor1]|nr:hypothetical protein ABI59_14270 [Acidobacteria bacterium Mor1]
MALVGAGCTPPPAEGEIEFSPEVFVETIGTGDVEDRIVCTGTLRSPETSSLRADTAGALAIGSDSAGRRLAEGSRVEAGQVIAEITGEEVRLAARTDATRERYETSKRDYDSTRSLHADGLVSDAELASAEANVAEARVELERSRLTETRSKLTTPISGVIISLARDDRGRPLPNGQLVAQGQVVAEIAPTSRLIADVDVVGPDVARITPGLTARVRHHAWDDERFTGRVSRLAPTLDPTTRTLRAEVTVNNGGGKLRPGMFVEATVVAERREGVVVAPRQAVTERQGRKVVFVIRGQRVEKREIALGLGDDEIVEVRSGLEAGERVVIRGLETLTDNNKVNVSGD